MVKKIIKELENIDSKVIKIVNYGLIFALGIGIIGVLMLLTYNTYELKYDIYDAGLLLIKACFTFSAESIACGFVFDKLIKNDAGI